jgi:serine/threonine-protein kinase
VVGDRYGVVRRLGVGGMGEVYEAEHLALGRLVAVKVLRPELRLERGAAARLMHEARVAAAVDHPNVCEIFDVGRLEDGSPFIAMERLQGRTLAERLKVSRKLAWSEAKDVAEQVLSAAAAAHEKGIVHCDLKPENVFLFQRAGIAPLAKVLDFGIARTGRDDGDIALEGGGVPGTPYSMAPEQARGDRELDGAVDVWAVGVMLYEALTGRKPFDAGNYNALLVQILTARHVPVHALRPDAPRGAIALVDRALSKAREERFRSAGEMLEVLVRVDQAAGLVVPVRAGAFVRSEETVVLEGSAAGKTDPLTGYDDPEATWVDDPPFGEDSVTMVRAEGGFPVPPRSK